MMLKHRKEPVNAAKYTFPILPMVLICVLNMKCALDVQCMNTWSSPDGIFLEIIWKLYVEVLEGGSEVL